MYSNFRYFSSCAIATFAFAFSTFSEKIELDPETSQSWVAYSERSELLAAADREHIDHELKANGMDEAVSPPKSRSWAYSQSNYTDDWFGSEKGDDFADNLISFQCPNGGWSKSLDFSKSHRSPGMTFASEKRYVSTIDNAATISQIRYLSRAYGLTNEEKYKSSVERGIEYLLNAQYPNGGWPQVYPLTGSYHDHATFNDRAMVGVLLLLADLSNPEFQWIPVDLRTKAKDAFDLGISFVLDSQIRRDGERVAWCQQHDPQTLEPRAARAYEMISLSSSESAQIVDLLMTIESPSNEVIEAIKGAIDWFRETRISGYGYERQSDGARALIPNPKAKPLWARFYEIETNKPLFGDRDGTIHYELGEISVERRSGYSWYVSEPDSTIQRFEKWKAKRFNEAQN